MKIYGGELIPSGSTVTLPVTALATTGSNTFNGNQTVNGSVVITGNLTAEQYIVSSSVTHLTTSFSSGSTKFGDTNDDTHQFTGSLRVSGNLSSTGRYLLGSDLSLIPLSGNQSVITTWWGMQLVGNRQLAVDYTPTAIGTNSDFSVIIPNQQATKIGLIVRGQTSQTGNLLEFRDVNNNGWSAFNNSGSLSLGKTTSNGILDVLGNAIITGSLNVTGSQTINGTLGVSIGGSTELSVQQTGVILGNLITDTHRVTGSLNVSGSITTTGTSTFSSLINANSQTVAANGSINVESLDPAIRFRVTSGTANSRIYEWRAVAAGGVNDIMQLRLWNDAQSSASTLFSVSPTGAGIFSSSVTATNLYLGTLTNEQLMVSGTGSRGIGVSTITSGDPFVRLYDNTTIKADIWWGRSGNYMGVNSLGAGSITAINPNGGSVGIGVTSPLARLQVGDGAQSGINGASNKIHIATTGTRSALLTLANSSGGTTVEGQFESSAESADLRVIIGTTSNHDLVIRTNNVERVRVTTAGVVQPGANGTQDLGTASLRWSTIYTSDLSLSNGIGDYTIVEGEEKLYLYNNKNNKVYSFVLHEEDPATATPKKS